MNNEEKFTDLRERAENRLEDSLMNFDNYSLKDIKTLIHEIQVHQIELEMQNDELISSQEKLKQTEKMFEYLYNFSPVAYCNIDENGYILNTNITFDKLVNKSKDELIRTDLNNLVDWDDRDNFYHLKKELNQNKKVNGFRLNLNDGRRVIPIEISAKYFDDSGSVYLMITDNSKIIELEKRLEKLESN